MNTRDQLIAARRDRVRAEARGEMLSALEVCERLGVSLPDLRAMRERGVIDAIKAHDTWLYSPDAVSRFEQERVK